MPAGRNAVGARAPPGNGTAKGANTAARYEERPVTPRYRPTCVIFTTAQSGVDSLRRTANANGSVLI
jgi:hypothetical protein